MIMYARTRSCSPFQEFCGLWKHEKTQHALYNQFGLGRATLLQLAFLGESDLNFPWQKFPLGQQSVQKRKLSLHTHSRLISSFNRSPPPQHFIILVKAPNMILEYTNSSKRQHFQKLTSNVYQFYHWPLKPCICAGYLRQQ